MKRLSIATATAVLMALGALAAAPARADRYVLDFETDASGNPLAPGTVIGEQWADYGVHISNAQKNSGNSLDKPLMLFDSSCKPKNWNASYDSLFSTECSGGDSDLATGKGQYRHGGRDISYDTPAQGNVLILDNDNDNNNAPNDSAGGGQFIFDFDNLVTLDKVTILDVDEGRGGWLKAFGEDDVLLKELDLLSAGDNFLTDYLFTDLDNVAKLIVQLPGSGAISGVEFTNLPQFEANTNDDPVDVPEPASTLALLALGTCGTLSTLKRKHS